MAEFRRIRLATFLGREDMTSIAEADTSALTAVMARAAAVFSDALTEQTRRSYVSRFEDFERWCDAKGHVAVPATPDSLILYLQSMVDKDPSISIATLRGRMAAISRVMVEAGYPALSRDTAVGLYFRGLRSVLGTGTRRLRVKPLRTPELRLVGEAFPETDARMLRDRAIFALLADGFSPRQVAGIRYADVVVRTSGCWLVVRDSDGARRVRLRDSPDKPTRSALVAWRDVAAPDPAQLFATTDQFGSRSYSEVSASDIDRTVQRRLAGLGLIDDEAPMTSAIRLLARGNAESLRDRALILIGWAAALRRVDLRILRWKHLTDVEQGILLYLPFSKTDRSGKGREIGIPYGRNQWSCPVTAAHAWRDFVAAQVPAAELDEWPVFVPLGRSGAIGRTPISTAAVSAILVRRTKMAGLDGRYSGRSLRSGLITSASEAGASIEEIQSISGHKDFGSLARYIDRSDPFRRNAARTAGL